MVLADVAVDTPAFDVTGLYLNAARVGSRWKSYKKFKAVIYNYKKSDCLPEWNTFPASLERTIIPSVIFITYNLL
jgi:hypothetical protein